MNTHQKLITRIKDLINVAPSGKRYSELRRELRAAFPDIPPNTIANSLGNFRLKLPEHYYVPVKGLYRSVKFKETDEVFTPDQGKRPWGAYKKVIAKAKELIDASPSGKRYSELLRELCTALPDISPRTIRAALGRFRTELPHDYYLPARGLYRNAKFKETDDLVSSRGGNTLMVPRIKEEEFYERFSDWLVNELEEATKAISLGGHRFKDKWGTPDVIAVREAKRSDIIKTPTEIISAEIKLDVAELIKAFGQCCSYKLFSHKSYLVVPRISAEEDISRLDSLARIFGIGLVLFELDNPNQPQFTIRARASREEPDMFYVNKYLRLIEDKLFP